MKHQDTRTLPLRANGGFDDARRELLVAHRDADDVARRDAAGQPRERDGLAERRAERAAGDFAVAVRGAHLLVGAQHAARVLQQQARSVAARAACASSAALPTKSRGLARSTVQAKPGHERRHRFVHVLAVEIHAGLEAQRVARAQPARSHAGCGECAPASLPRRLAGTMISKPSSPV